MKIQLGMEAVEAIINSFDRETKIEIKDFIVKEFSRRYLKDIVNNQLIASLKKEILTEGKKQFMSEIGDFKSVGWSHTLTLNSEFKGKISAHIESTIDSMIRAEVNAAVSAIDFSNEIATLVDAMITRKIRETVDSEINRRWSALIDKINS